MIRKQTGAYKQADLEKMTNEDLQNLAEWAETEWNKCKDCWSSDTDCERCQYLELLVGAANELLDGRLYGESE